MKTKAIAGVMVFAVMLVVFSALCIAFPGEDYSLSERRPLAQMPELSMESVFDGSFSRDFDTYTSERIPFRESMRRLKAWFTFDILGRKDNNGLFMENGHISRLDTEENDYMTNYAVDKFKEIYNSYMLNKDCRVYFSIVPDKNMFLASRSGYPSIDYEGFISRMKEKTGFMEYIDILPLLDSGDYYNTDTHWKQESITDIASHIASSMGTAIGEEYRVNTLDIPFYGVYHGQLARDFKSDTIKYLTNSIIDNCKVTYYDTGLPREGSMYSMKKAQSKDAYEMFLEGSMPLVTIENPANTSGRELVMLRDSFGSSLAPLLAEGYSKITLADIRYMSSKALGSFVDFENCDVLFIYSTALLNNSTAIK